MDPKIENLMLQDFYGAVSADPDLAGLFSPPVRKNVSLTTKFKRDIFWHMSGSDVTRMQKLLGVPQTGTYDEATNAAVVEFQRSQMRDSMPTGVIDQATWNAIESGRTGGQKAAQTIADTFSILSPITTALTGPAPSTTVVAAPAESGTNWLLIGGLALGGLVVVGGAIYFFTRD